MSIRTFLKKHAAAADREYKDSVMRNDLSSDVSMAIPRRELMKHEGGAGGELLPVLSSLRSTTRPTSTDTKSYHHSLNLFASKNDHSAQTNKFSGNLRRAVQENADQDPWNNFQHPIINRPNKANHTATSNSTAATTTVPDDDNLEQEPKTGGVPSAGNSTTVSNQNYSGKPRADTDGASTTHNQTTTPGRLAPPSSSLTKCHTLSCRTGHVLTNPFVFGSLVLVMLFFYVRRRSRRVPSQGAYRAVAAQYVSSAFDEELSPDDYLSDDEGDEFWTHGKKSIEMGTFSDDLTLDEVNG